MYFLRPGIKANPERRWALPDRIFFGHGACHILAGVHLADFSGSGFRPLWIQPNEGYSGNHIILRNGEIAFDFHGYSCVDRLLAYHWRGWSSKFPGWSAHINEIDFDLLNTSELNARGMRGPNQYFGDPISRARRFLLNFKPEQ